MTAEPVLAHANGVRLPRSDEVGSGGFQREFQQTASVARFVSRVWPES